MPDHNSEFGSHEPELASLQAALRDRSIQAQETIVGHLRTVGVRFLSAEEVDSRIGEVPREGSDSANGRGLLVVEYHGAAAYPDFQLDDRVSTGWLQEILKHFEDHWAVLSFLTAHRRSLAGKSHLERILAGETGAVEGTLSDIEDYLR